MIFDEGKHRLMIHAGLAAGSASTAGLLGSLRPYQGIQEPMFHDIVEAILAVSPSLASPEPHVDKDVVYSLYCISHVVRAWAIDPTGMLRRNRLIADRDVETLERWLDVIERVVLQFFRGSQRHLSMFAYVELLAQSDSPLTVQQQFIFPVLMESMEAGDADHQLPAVVVLGRFRKTATTAVPVLRRLLSESTDQEVREACDLALQAITLASP